MYNLHLLVKYFIKSITYFYSFITVSDHKAAIECKLIYSVCILKLLQTRITSFMQQS